jgi:hypothetical protein
MQCLGMMRCARCQSTVYEVKQEIPVDNVGKEGVTMKRSFVPVALVLVVGLGSYAIFGQQQQSPDQPQQGMMGGGGMMQGQGGMGGGGMMPPGSGMQGTMMGGGMGGGGMVQGQGGMMGGGMMQPGGGMQGGMMMQGRGGMMGGGMGRGVMMQQGGMPCPACAALCGALMHESVTPTSDGGVVVSVAGKLIKYDSGLNKVKETNLDIDWAKVHQMAEQIMQNCPMNHRVMPPLQGWPQGQRRGQFQPQQ